MDMTYIVSVRGTKQTWTCYRDNSEHIVLYNLKEFASDCKLVFDPNTKGLLNPGVFPFLADAELVSEPEAVY